VSPGVGRSATPGRPAAGGQRRVLVAEDDPVLNDLLAAALREAGCAPLQAFDGPAALDLARRRRPALISLDLDLPGLHGPGVLRALERDPATAAIPVVLVTGTADGWPREELRGALALVRKPFDLDRTVRLLVAVAAAAVRERGGSR
jgi:CheY-like chemotaxis protein